MVTWRLKAGEEDRSYSSSISAKDIDRGGSEGAGQEGRKQAGGEESGGSCDPGL